MLNSLNVTGRMAVVVPHGVLFRGAAEKDIRKTLILENQLDAVIGLPEKLFYRGNMPSAIMILKKVKVDQNVLFIDASNLFQVGRSRNVLRHKDISTIVGLYKSREDVQYYSYLVSTDEINGNEYNLNISRYIDSEKRTVVNMSELTKNKKMKSSFNVSKLDIPTRHLCRPHLSFTGVKFWTPISEIMR